MRHAKTAGLIIPGKHIGRRPFAWHLGGAANDKGSLLSARIPGVESVVANLTPSTSPQIVRSTGAQVRNALADLNSQAAILWIVYRQSPSAQNLYKSNDGMSYNCMTQNEISGLVQMGPPAIASVPVTVAENVAPPMAARN